MQINRYNYEEYFLLYTDNELDAQERAAVEAFAAGNPDLQEELARLQQYKLAPEKIVFPGKENLLKQTTGNQLIHTNNYEEYFLLYADNELNEQERTCVEQFVQEHPALQEEFTLINQASLAPDDSIRYPAKERLYRYEHDRVVPFAWWKVAAAAAVVLIAGVLWLNKNHSAAAPQVIARQEVSGSSRSDSDKLISQTPGNKIVSSNNSSTPVKQENSITTTVEQPAHASIARTEKPMAKKAEKSVYRLSSPIERTVEQLHANSVAVNTINPAALKTREPIIDKPAVFGDQAAAEAPDDAGAGDTRLASNNDTEDVYITNISVGKKIPLKGLFRKASRIINKATGLNTGEKGILIGNVEIALK